MLRVAFVVEVGGVVGRFLVEGVAPARHPRPVDPTLPHARAGAFAVGALPVATGAEEHLVETGHETSLTVSVVTRTKALHSQTVRGLSRTQ